VKSVANCLATDSGDYAQLDSRRHWSVIRDVLHKAKINEIVSESDCIQRCQSFSEFFQSNIQKIKTITRTAGTGYQDSLQSYRQHEGSHLADFPPPTVVEVTKLINNLPGKSSPQDYIPTSIIKSCVDVLSPLITSPLVPRWCFPNTLQDF